MPQPKKIKCAKCGSEMELIAINQPDRKGDIKLVCHHCNTMLYRDKSGSYQSTTFNYTNRRF